MQSDYRKLRGRIVEKFDTAAKFADALGITRSALNTKLTKGTQFSIEQIFNACRLLDISKEEIGIYFFDVKTAK